MSALKPPPWFIDRSGDEARAVSIRSRLVSTGPPEAARAGVERVAQRGNSTPGRCFSMPTVRTPIANQHAGCAVAACRDLAAEQARNLREAVAERGASHQPGLAD